MPKPPANMDVNKIEVERRGLLDYVVVERRPSGFDSEWTPGHWFCWTAVRHARRLAAGPRFQKQVVFSIGLAAVGKANTDPRPDSSAGDR